jgi:hypothetical protein
MEGRLFNMSKTNFEAITAGVQGLGRFLRSSDHRSAVGHGISKAIL